MSWIKLICHRLPEASNDVTAGHSEQDSFISKVHSQKLHKAYAGDKNLIMFEGDHNSHRPQFFYASALIFLNTVLQIDKHLPVAEAEATAAHEGGCVCQFIACLRTLLVLHQEGNLFVQISLSST